MKQLLVYQSVAVDNDDLRFTYFDLFMNMINDVNGIGVWPFDVVFIQKVQLDGGDEDA